MPLREKLKRMPSLMVGALISLSRLLGFLRDMIFATFFGTTWYFDAFVIAFRIPNILRELLGEGALSSAVVTGLGHVEKEKGRDGVRIVLGRLVALWSVMISGICILGIIVAPWLMGLCASGKDAEFLQLATSMSRIMFPYLMLVSMGALSMGVLHHCRRFNWPASASSLYNIIIILGLIVYFVLLKGQSGRSGVVFLSWLILLAGLGQWLIQWPGFRGTGLSLVPTLKEEAPEAVKILRQVLPAALGAAGVQINVLVNTAYATKLAAGTVSAIYYSFRLTHLPIAIIGVSIATVLLPNLTKRISDGDHQGFTAELTRAIGNVIRLILPAAVGLFIMSDDIISILFQRNQFNAQSTAMTSLALKGFALGIPAYAINRLLFQAFYAHKDFKTPAMISLSLTAFNAGLNYLLVFVFDFGLLGLTAGTSVVIATNTLFLTLLLYYRHQKGLAWWPLLRMLCWRLLLCLIMAGFLFIGREWLLSGVISTLALCALGGGLYLALDQWLSKKYTSS